jgi:hypothetical protein
MEMAEAASPVQAIVSIALGLLVQFLLDPSQLCRVGLFP